MAKQKVAVVYPFFEHYRQSLVEELSVNGSFDYVFFGDKEDPVSGSYIKAATFGSDVDFRWTKCYLVGPFLIQTRLFGLSTGKQFKAIIFHGGPYYLTTWVAATLARITGKKVYFIGHGWTRNNKGFRDSVKVVFFRLAHKLLVYGEHARRIAIERRFHEDRVVVIYNSIRRFREVRNQLRNEQNLPDASSYFDDATIPVIISIGRLVSLKKLDQLIDAVVLLKDQGHAMNVLLVGDGPERSKLEDYAIHRGVSIRFLGAVYDDNIVGSLISTCAVCVVPGRMGLTAMDSMGFGTPVVTHDDYSRHSPEFEAIRDGETGSFYESDNVQSLASSIKMWVDGTTDRDRTRATCYQIIDQYYSPETQREIIDKAISSGFREDMSANSDRNMSGYSDHGDRQE